MVSPAAPTPDEVTPSPLRLVWAVEVSTQGLKLAKGVMVVLGAAVREAFLQRDSVAGGREGRMTKREGRGEGSAGVLQAKLTKGV